MSGLRRRVFLALAATALLATVLTVAVATVVLHRQAEQRRAQALSRLADTAAGPLAASLPGAGPKVVLTGTPRGTRRLRPAGAQAVLAQVHAATGRVRLHGRELNYDARDTSAGRIVLLGATGAAARNGPPPARTVLLAGVGGLLFALVLSVPLARRLTRPLDRLAAGAGRVAAGEPGVAVDVRGDDELGRLGTAFNTMASELERSRDAERTFLLAVSHELKTPLSAVRGYAEAIDDGAVEPRHGAAVIAEEATRIERLVADLLDLARMRATGFAVRHEPLDLARVAAEAVARHAARARSLGIELADESVAAPGAGDAERALQAVSNLVENALRVLAPGGRVTVAARPGAIEVRDDGPGIAAEDVPRAFERSFLHARGRRPGTAGLGLALVRELATAMGGDVRLESAPGRTVFTLALG